MFYADKSEVKLGDLVIGRGSSLLGEDLAPLEIIGHVHGFSEAGDKKGDIKILFVEPVKDQDAPSLWGREQVPHSIKRMWGRFYRLSVETGFAQNFKKV